jgi:MFS transporter, FHS family, L-fucose permease
VMLVGGIFVSQDHAAVTALQHQESLRHIDAAFLVIAGALSLLGIFIWTVRKRLANHSKGTGGHASILDAFRSGWALLGALAIFLYVGSEVSIGSTLTNFLHQDDVLGNSLERAGKLVSLYWGGAMIGRFAGSLLLTRVSAGLLLGVAALVASLLCLVVSQAAGATSGYAALSIGLFNSVMFPVIFTLTLERSSASKEATSGLLCMAIVGGALLPLLMGHTADLFGLRSAYIVPLAGYVCIAAFGLAASRARMMVKSIG